MPAYSNERMETSIFLSSMVRSCNSCLMELDDDVRVWLIFTLMSMQIEFTLSLSHI